MSLDPPMQVWAVFYHPESFTEDLYQRALKVIDDLDSTAAARIKRFYRREDACRTLIGHFLRRMMLHEQGINVSAVKFAVTATGKPYIASPVMDPPIEFNITHDNALIAMAVSSYSRDSPKFSNGIDVMKLRIPGKESFPSFVRTVGDQLTSKEHRLIFSGTSTNESLQRFFWMWTMKEAYTKALGIGLGFEFKRVEFDVEERVLRVDGEVPRGWCFRMCMLEDGEDVYEAVVAENLGGDRTTKIIYEDGTPKWLRRYDAASFVEDALQSLGKDI